MKYNLIFDLDGTLVDSSRDIQYSLSEAYKECNYNIDFNFKSMKIGPPLTEMIEEVTPKLTTERKKQISEKFKSIYDNCNYDNTYLYDNVTNVLLDLKKKGCKIFIATSKRKISTLRILKKFDILNLFEDIITTDNSDGINLTKSDMVKLLLSKNLLDKNSTFMIGDSASDIKSGIENNIKTIAVLYGYDEKEILIKCNSDYFINKFTDIIDIIFNDERKKNIIILGATSHIAKGLIVNFLRIDNINLFLCARSITEVKKFIETNKIDIEINIMTFEEFDKFNYDVIINCVGIGVPSKSNSIIENVFKLTEYFDNLIIDFLHKKPNTLYINLSSGAVYGNNCSYEIDDTAKSVININNIQKKDYYAIAKINSEVKHRAYFYLNIVDLRIFSYFSEYIDLRAGYLLTEILQNMIEKKDFITNSTDISRDYIDPEDLFHIIILFINKIKINDVFDVYSKEPISKFKLLDFFKKEFGFNYSIVDDNENGQNNNSKNQYYSKSKKLSSLGYIPKFTSLETIFNETKSILTKLS